MKMHWLDRVTSELAPIWTLRRQQARLAQDLVKRHYEAASSGRRTSGWRRNSGDAEAVIGPALARLREAARDLVRNNPYAESAVSTIADHAVGGGITAKPSTPNKKAMAVWKRWAESTTCDADGRHDFYGLQKLVMRTVVESGEVLARRRLRFPADGFPLNLQIQLLDPDFIDTAKNLITLANGGRIIHGVEFDAIGRRGAYWLFPQHPGSQFGFYDSSQRVPSEGITHIFKGLRPGQVRGPSWYAPVLLRAKDFDEYEDATLMKQKIAACLAVLTTDPDGTAIPIGTADDSLTPAIDMLEPGAIMNMPPGRTIEVVNPPQTSEYDAYGKTQLRAIATGLGVTYEDLTGDYQALPFSAARMSRLRHWARVEDWRWRILIPQFCNPCWNWVMTNAMILGEIDSIPAAQWTAEPAPMVDPVNEGLAYQRLMRVGLRSYSESLREQGFDPDVVLAEIAADNARLDALGIVLDSDPRRTTQAGQTQGTAKSDGDPPAAEPRKFGAELDRFAAFLADLPDDRATEIFRKMFESPQ